jgi:hypothetical protein
MFGSKLSGSLVLLLLGLALLFSLIETQTIAAMTGDT